MIERDIKATLSFDPDCDYNKSRYLLFNDKEHGTIRISNCDSENTDGSYYLKNGILHYSSDMCPLDKDIEFIRNLPKIKVYTKESYEDIINSFRAFPTINVAQKSDLAKRLVKNR